MRKRLALWGALIIAAAVFLPWATGAVDDYKDNVSVYEEVLEGDRAEAEGLRVESVTNMDSRLFWETDFWPGSDKDAATEFKFYPSRKHERWSSDGNYFNVSPANGNFGVSGSEIDLEEELTHSRNELWEPILDVAGLAPAGEVYSETVYLKDYYDWFPVRIEAWFDDGLEGVRRTWIEYEKNIVEEMTEFLKVAIPDNIKLDIMITKSDYGVTGVECLYSNDSIINLNQWAYGIMTEDGGYFAVAENSEQWKDGMLMSLRSEQIAQDYGIYHIPLKPYVEEGVTYTEGEGPVTFDVAKIRNAFPLDSEAVKVLTLHYDSESDQLMLMTEESDRLHMTIIDRKTMTALQKLDLGAIAENEYVTDTLTRDNLRMIQIREEYQDGRRVTPQRMVLLVKEGSRWSVKVSAPITWPGQETEEMLFSVNEYAQLAWNGEKLAIVQFARYNNSCDIYVLVCRDDDLTYAGAYRRTDTSGSVYMYDSSIRPFNDEGLKAIWE